MVKVSFADTAIVASGTMSLELYLLSEYVPFEIRCKSLLEVSERYSDKRYNHLKKRGGFPDTPSCSAFFTKASCSECSISSYTSKSKPCSTPPFERLQLYSNHIL